MVPYEASTRVPLVVAGPGVVQGKTFHQATSLIDLYPTLLELARAEAPAGHDVDGHSLVPLLSGKAGAADSDRPPWALSQGHMADNAISWFVLRQVRWRRSMHDNVTDARSPGPCLCAARATGR
jgi:arylsulfatase A-like enzyme